MFDSLTNIKFNWYIFAGIAVLILLLKPDISPWCFIALLIGIHQFMLIFYAFKYIIPVRYIAGAFMSLQMLIGPSFAYLGLDSAQYFKYRMQVSEVEYFGYAIPATICFILGLHFFSKLKGEIVNQQAIKDYVAQNPTLAYLFIVIGVFNSIAADFFGPGLGFVLYLIGSFKFAGAFLLIIGSPRLKPLPLTLVFGSIILSTLQKAMFHDLVTWLIFILAVFALRYKPKDYVKLAFAIGLIAGVAVIQQLKASYRTATIAQGKAGDVEAFDDAFDEMQTSGGFFEKANLAKHNVRINQGFILTNVLRHVPYRTAFAHGQELYQILEAAFLPRILAPNKLDAGDKTLVFKYAGISLRKHTSMSLGSMADAYINYGRTGGCIFMFALGLFFNLTLIWFYNMGKKFPIIILFVPMAFYFPIRPDTALQTGLGHLVKCTFLIWVVFTYWAHIFETRLKVFRKTSPSELSV
ncbi:MAG: hypothetical protein IPI98_06645 [Chitinophagaceae bacterium]|nr:hypothetical protein [Chitinophagaceae bacterium]